MVDRDDYSELLGTNKTFSFAILIKIIILL